jgi:hypothetical protein
MGQLGSLPNALPELLQTTGYDRALYREWSRCNDLQMPPLRHKPGQADTGFKLMQRDDNRAYIVRNNWRALHLRCPQAAGRHRPQRVESGATLVVYRLRF